MHNNIISKKTQKIQKGAAVSHLLANHSYCFPVKLYQFLHLKFYLKNNGQLFYVIYEKRTDFKFPWKKSFMILFMYAYFCVLKHIKKSFLKIHTMCNSIFENENKITLAEILHKQPFLTIVDQLDCPQALNSTVRLFL